jgi:excinuclease ABC subunit C
MSIDKAKKLKDTLKKIPNLPGIYKMIDEENRVIYLGKAKNLKNRVKSYFQKNYSHSSRTKVLLEKVENIEFITVDSDLEAIILEHNLLKQLKPKYNVIMKDDKSFVYIKITKEDFPRIEIVRKPEKDNAKYIGPKTSTQKVKDTLKILKSLFPYRHCGLNIKLLKENEIPPHLVEVSNKIIKYPCLDYHIKKCSGPCIGMIGKEKYMEMIQNVVLFLEGKSDFLMLELKKNMTNYAANKQFEKAAKIRDKLRQLENISERQKISSPDRKDTDIINYLINDQKAYFNLFQTRNGNLTGQENFIYEAKLEENNTSSSEVLETFLKDYYTQTNDIPKEILLPHNTENLEEIRQYLNIELQINPEFLIPKIGEKIKLLEMSLNNAKIYADRNRPSWKEENNENSKTLKILSKALELKEDAKRIECYDISHFGGTNTVASMVVFENGAPKSKDYRKFKLKSLNGKIDDFKSMEEILKRRLAYLNNTPFKLKKIKKDNKYILEIATKKIEMTFDKPKPKNLILKFQTSEKIKKSLKCILLELAKKEKISKIYFNAPPKEKEWLFTQGFEEIKDPSQKNNLCFYVSKHKKDQSFNKKPDLIIIDGGKGQLKSALKAINEFNLKIPMISLAKKFEEIFLPEKNIPIILRKNSKELKLIQRIRDEAHRFAITFQKNSRSF